MSRSRWGVLAWLVWASILLASYYRRLWAVPSLGLRSWVRDNPSLGEAVQLLRFLRDDALSGNLPALGEAASRSLSALFGASMVLAAAFGLGSLACALLRFRGNDLRDEIVFRASAGIGVLSYASLILAAMGLYRPAAVRILVIAPAGATLLWIARRLLAGRRNQATVARAAEKTGPRAEWIWIAVSLAALGIAFVSALAPEIEYDALWYHLWLPRMWLENGGPVDIVPEFISLYPLTWELVFNAGAVLGGPVAGKLLHFACLPLVGVVVFQLARLAAPRAPRWLAVALFLTVPTVLWEATTAYVDLALAFHTSLALYALLTYLESKRADWFAQAILNLGLALATKHLGLFVLLILFLGLSWRLLRTERDWKRVAAPLALLAGVSLLFPLPWYARNWLASGNPVFPDLYSVFGARPPERWNEATERGWREFEARFGRPRTFVNEVTLPWDLTVHAARYDGAFGPLFLLFAPALLFVRCFPPAAIGIGGFVLAYLALWCSPLNGREFRFLIPLAPLLAVLAAAACARLHELVRTELGKGAGATFLAAAGILLCLNLPPFTSLHEVDRVGWDGWLTHVIHRVPLPVVLGGETEEDYLRENVPSYAAWHYINRALPLDAYVLTFSGGDHLYSERRRLPSESVPGSNATWRARDEMEAIARLKDLGVTHVLFDKTRLDGLPPSLSAVARSGTAARWSREYEDERFALFRVAGDGWAHGETSASR